MRNLLICFSIALPLSSLLAATATAASPVGLPKDFARKTEAIFALAGKPTGQSLPPEVEAVFHETTDGEPGKPVAPIKVRLKAVDGHAPTYVLGEAVKLAIEETGDIRERHWEIDPPVKDSCHPDPVKKDSLWWVSPSTGEYTVIVTSVGRQSGIATDRIKIRLGDSAGDDSMAARSSSVGKSIGGSGGINADAAAHRALRLVDASSRQVTLAHVRDVVNASNTLSDARAYLLRPVSLGPERAKAWVPFFDAMERAFDAMRDDGKLPTADEERGAMESLAKAMGEGS